MSEEKIKSWALPKIKQFRTYIDIGASTGKTSLPFVENFEKIICFEPNPESFSILSKNKELECYDVALGSSSETKRLYMNSETNNPEHGSISDNRIKTMPVGNYFTVNVEKLDDYKFFHNVDFIKIDTEQYEYDVIQGALKTIKKNRPTIMFENKRNEADNAVLLLLELGFTIKKYKSDTVAFYEDLKE